MELRQWHFLAFTIDDGETGSTGVDDASTFLASDLVDIGQGGAVLTHSRAVAASVEVGKDTEEQSVYGNRAERSTWYSLCAGPLSVLLASSLVVLASKDGLELTEEADGSGVLLGKLLGVDSGGLDSSLVVARWLARWVRRRWVGVGLLALKEFTVVVVVVWVADDEGSLAHSSLVARVAFASLGLGVVVWAMSAVSEAGWTESTHVGCGRSIDKTWTSGRSESSWSHRRHTPS